MRRRRRIGFFVFDGITALDLVGPMEAFASVRDSSGIRLYELLTFAKTRREIKAENGLIIKPSELLVNVDKLDTVVIPGGAGLRERTTATCIANWLALNVKRVRRIASICTGIYGVAPSGLLDGREVTTHWRFARDVQARFPKLKVNAASIFLVDGNFYTSAGITSGIDLALALIEEDCGQSVALSVARELIVFLKRPGGQDQYSEPLRFQISATDKTSDLAAWIDSNLEKKLSVQVMAEKACLSERQFARHFKDVFRMTPPRTWREHALNVQSSICWRPIKALTTSRAQLAFPATMRSAAHFTNTSGCHQGDIVTRSAVRNVACTRVFLYNPGDPSLPQEPLAFLASSGGLISGHSLASNLIGTWAGFMVRDGKTLEVELSFVKSRQPAPVPNYYCPMDRHIQSDRPGTCSICGMQLIRENRELRARFTSLTQAVMQYPLEQLKLDGGLFRLLSASRSLWTGGQTGRFSRERSRMAKPRACFSYIGPLRPFNLTRLGLYRSRTVPPNLQEQFAFLAHEENTRASFCFMVAAAVALGDEPLSR